MPAACAWPSSLRATSSINPFSLATTWAKVFGESNRTQNGRQAAGCPPTPLTDLAPFCLDHKLSWKNNSSLLSCFPLQIALVLKWYLLGWHIVILHWLEIELEDAGKDVGEML